MKTYDQYDELLSETVPLVLINGRSLEWSDIPDVPPASVLDAGWHTYLKPITAQDTAEWSVTGHYSASQRHSSIPFWRLCVYAITFISLAGVYGWLLGTLST